MRFLKKHLATILLLIILAVGAGLLGYPFFSNYWNSLHQSASIDAYQKAVSSMTVEEREQMLADAEAYNEKIAVKGNGFELSDAERKEYNSLLDVNGTGMMGYITIDKINVNLPIYHSTSETVMAAGIGHLEGTSLPVGGKSTHCVLSGHRGLPSAKLFTDLDQLETGDTFMIDTLNRKLTYEVDQIRIVLPEDTSALNIEEGKDYCTLITCTPYGVNSHRLLIRGHRVKNASDDHSECVTADGIQIEPVIIAPLAAAPVLLILLIFQLWDTKQRSLRNRISREWKEEKDEV